MRVCISSHLGVKCERLIPADEAFPFIGSIFARRRLPCIADSSVLSACCRRPHASPEWRYRAHISGPQRLTDQRWARRHSVEWGQQRSLRGADTVAPPESRRSLPVAPLIRDKRCYGEALAGLRGRSGGGRRKSPAAGKGENTSLFNSSGGAAAETHLDRRNRSPAPALAGA
jgi:hypothetical protein